MSGLLLLEKEVFELSRPMLPLVVELKASLEAIWHDCEIEESDRIPQLHEDTWTLAEYMKGESQVGGLSVLDELGSRPAGCTRG
jgi:hypothetical protein